LESIWDSTVEFFKARDPEQIEKAQGDPKKKMALIFRWYLGLSSRWSNSGEKGREMDYQIWCGPAMGAFNDWVRGSYLEDPHNRHIADINKQILAGCAYLLRLRQLESQGILFPAKFGHYPPTQI